MTEPLVSVVIPTYKRTWEYLGRAVDSVLSQTYKNIEIIVIDDSPSNYEKRNSVQNSMKSLCKANQNVRYLINEENIGGSLSRNRGIDAALGSYITFLDDDDEYLPSKVKHQVQFMQDNGCDLSFENMIMYNANGAVVDSREYIDLVDTDNEYLLSYHLMKHLTGTPTFMFKTEKLREIGGFENAKMGQEFYLMLKSIERNLKIRYYPVCDIKVYKHSDGGISQGKNKIVGEKALYSFKKQYFGKLNAKQRRFIRFRHLAVMVIAYMRNKMYLHACATAVASFVSSPVDFVVQVSGFFKRIINKRGCTNESI